MLLLVFEGVRPSLQSSHERLHGGLALLEHDQGLASTVFRYIRHQNQRYPLRRRLGEAHLLRRTGSSTLPQHLSAGRTIRNTAGQLARPSSDVCVHTLGDHLVDDRLESAGLARGCLIVLLEHAMLFGMLQTERGDPSAIGTILGHVGVGCDGLSPVPGWLYGDCSAGSHGL